MCFSVMQMRGEKTPLRKRPHIPPPREKARAKEKEGKEADKELMRETEGSRHQVYNYEWAGRGDLVGRKSDGGRRAYRVSLQCWKLLLLISCNNSSLV